MEVRAPLAPAERLAGILQLVAAELDLLPELIRGVSRQRELVHARWLVMTLAQRCLGYSLPRIGRLMQRDHTSVLHGIRSLAALARADATLAARIEALAARLSPRTETTQ